QPAEGGPIMAMNQVSSGARALDSGTTLKSRSDYGRNADGSRQSPASAWASRLVMLAVLVLFSLPLYWMIVSALKSPQELAQFPPTLFPSEFHWQNFLDATTRITFSAFFRNDTHKT